MDKIQVAIIGAGPAGLFAAEKLAAMDYGVAIFNRDIKPGGMAEYGIYPEKHTVKEGLLESHVMSHPDGVGGGKHQRGVFVIQEAGKFQVSGVYLVQRELRCPQH